MYSSVNHRWRQLCVLGAATNELSILLPSLPPRFSPSLLPLSLIFLSRSPGAEPPAYGVWLVHSGAVWRQIGGSPQVCSFHIHEQKLCHNTANSFYLGAPM